MSRKTAKTPHRDSLNHRQTLYVIAYLERFNGALAAELAGYSKKSAKDISKHLQRLPLIRASIDKALEERERESKDRTVIVMEHAYNQATADITDLFDDEGAPLPLSKMPRELRRAISSLEVEFEWSEGKRIARVAKIKLHDKRASQELFAKYAGKLKERVEVEGALTLEQLVPRRKVEGE